MFLAIMVRGEDLSLSLLIRLNEGIFLNLCHELIRHAKIIRPLHAVTEMRGGGKR